MREQKSIRKKSMYFIPPLLLLVLVVCFLFIEVLRKDVKIPEMVMGGNYYTAERRSEEIITADDSSIAALSGRLEAVRSRSTGSKEETDGNSAREVDAETYFRPSKLPVLNNRYVYPLFDEYNSKKPSEIELPASLFDTPENTILNYFSVLREAANLEKGKGTGCGTLGESTLPYPIAYNFLTKSYQERLSYKKYLKTFENILHINLLKYHKVPVYDNADNILRYFVELETIEGTESNRGSFVYYYGFADLQEENGEYKISNLEFHGEDYLCAPYHGWAYDAEMSVEIRYGGWCDMIDEMYPIKQEGYIKNLSFRGKDGMDYLIVFYQLTNDTDIEIAQYQKAEAGEWKLIKLNPEDCVKEKDNDKNKR